MGIFGNKDNDNNADIRANEKKKPGSKFGRNITSIQSAKDELFYNVQRKNTIENIKYGAKNKLNFYGHHHIGENKNEAFYIKEDDVTMEIYIGSTGTGKGVFLGNKILESAYKGKGQIIIDPKKDDYAPAVAEKIAKELNISFQVASWSENLDIAV